jgi:hypothetical protein
VEQWSSPACSTTTPYLGGGGAEQSKRGCSTPLAEELKTRDAQARARRGDIAIKGNERHETRIPNRPRPASARPGL